ncbi:meiotic recombination [Coemansia sp. RSA 1804]|nr:meiotic recombination [Coemansia sp. RSA 1804]
MSVAANAAEPAANVASADRNSNNDNSSNTLTVLVATDNHLGFMERDPVRSEDSFHAFDEILQLAKAHRADMVLLGGDLFHENKPSRRTMHRAMALLRKHCMGDAPVAVEYLSDPQVDFPVETQQHVNYEDPNLNIALPVFSIHGNHDDPAGDGNLSAMDTLAVSGLVNYFGRQAEIERIRVSPVLLRKGSTHVALFGLGNIRDERLHRTMARKRLVMCQPAEDTDRWFNLMVLHQNRVPHGPKNHIPEHFLSDFLDLVVWGHEHQCAVEPEYNHQRSFYVTQPGSSVATALSSGEAAPKHVALLRISGRSFKLDKIRIKNVRPFVIEDVVLSQVAALSPQSSEDEIIAYLRDKVEALLVLAQDKYEQQLHDTSASACIDPALGLHPRPLVRVRVEYSGGFETFHPQRFGLLFADRVANPRDIVYFYRKQPATRSPNSNSNSISVDAAATQDDSAASVGVPAPMDAVHVESLIGEFLDDANMQMLVDVELAEAVRQFVHKGDNDAIVQSLKASVDTTQKRIFASSSTDAGAAVNEASLDNHIAAAREQRRQRAIEAGHGLVDSARDDAMVAVTLVSRRSAINAADRQAITSFERAASKRNSSAASSSSVVVASPAPENSDDGSGSNDDDDNDDEEFRNAGSTASKKKPVVRQRRIATAAAASTNTTDKKRPPPLMGLVDHTLSMSSKSSSGSNKREFSAISRPSRSARSTLHSAAAASNRGSSAEPFDVDSDAIAELEVEAKDEEVEDEEDEIENSIPPTPLANRKRQRKTAAAVMPSEAKKQPSARGGRSSTGRGRGRGRGRGSKSSGASSTSQRSSTASSQMPLVAIGDDDDDDDEAADGSASNNRRFGRFSLRKRD